LPYGIGARVSKDEVFLHRIAVAAHERIANYWHMLPETSQGRKAVWNAVNPHSGRRRIDEAFPKELRETTLENEMLIRFKNGSTYQVLGSDNYDSLVGAPPAGVVFSEWPLANPAAWAFIRPMLLENKGWAGFAYTPRGRNHGATFFEAHKNDADWFVEALSARETDVFSPEQLDNELAEYIKEFGKEDGENRFNQEYLVSFTAGVPGSYYGGLMEDAERGGRICEVPWLPDLPVFTAWDLGRRDYNSIWFFQLPAGTRGPVHFVDYLENNGVDVTWYAKELDKRPYRYGTLALPHDAESEHVAADKSVAGTLRTLGYRDQCVVRRSDNINHDINAVRVLLPRARFDKVKCERGISALQNYHKAWDDERKVYNDRPYHDWASNGADAMRAGAVALHEGLLKTGLPSRKLVYPKLGIA